MISATSITIRRGTKVLIEGGDFNFYRNQKIGVTGANGSGKSSLFAVLQDELSLDRGELNKDPNLTVAHVAQALPDGNGHAIEYVIDGDIEFRDLERRLARAEESGDPQLLGSLHEQMGFVGGYSARARAAKLLSGLGFSEDEFLHPVSHFSGGWRMRLNLAQALMCRSDLLLLDEPTNHLDLDAVVWLESWLKTYEGTLLLISHDREFLDNVVGFICHIESGRLKTFTGNYSNFEIQRASILAQEKSLYAKQQREVAHLRFFVDRFRAKATKAKQAQSRLKQLAKMQLVVPAQVVSPFEFKFKTPSSWPDPAMVVKGVDLGYPDKVVLRGVSFELRSGDRYGLVGPNGAGKSTFVKFLAGELEKLSGEVTKNRDILVGYFAQNSLDQLRNGDSPLQHLVRLAPLVREQDLRDFLGGFGFRGDDVFKEVGSFSGGERSRLALALIVWQKPNVLLLDEPTNHLDMQMRFALSRALQEFEGAVVLVSHDRALLKETCDQLLMVNSEAVSLFDEDLDAYANFLLRTSSKKGEAESSKLSKKDQRRIEAEARSELASRVRPLKQKLSSLEKRLETLGAKKLELESRLSDPNIYEDKNKLVLVECSKEKAVVDKEIVELEEEWIRVSSELQDLME